MTHSSNCRPGSPDRNSSSSSRPGSPDRNSSSSSRPVAGSSSSSSSRPVAPSSGSSSSSQLGSQAIVLAYLIDRLSTANSRTKIRSLAGQNHCQQLTVLNH